MCCIDNTLQICSELGIALNINTIPIYFDQYIIIFIAMCAAELRAEDGVDMLCREAYLSDADFEQVPPARRRMQLAGRTGTW